ncbi:MAG: hypothetical protein NC177_13780 [Ruminococcus flavefaciens]|nr:hypothetical protein [Ruminococcus flavefaciens]
MRIELINNSNTSNSTSLLDANLSSLISQSETSISSLRSLKNFSHSMNGGVGLLQSAVDSIDARIEQEETRKGDLVDTKTKIDRFTELVGITDRSVSTQVTQNQEMFYDVNEWSRPSALASQLGAWFASAKSWLSRVAKDSLDAFDHTWSVYNETDYSSLSDEELKNLCNRYLEMLESDELSQDDKTRLQSFLNYLSQTEVNSSMSDSDKKKVELFNSIYEKMHDDEAKAINKFFTNSSRDGIDDDDISNIKYIAYKSDGDAHKIFFDNIAKCKVQSWKYTKGSHYRPFDNDEEKTGVYLNIGGDDGIKDKDGAYTTFFHEIGHNIDDVMFYNDLEYDSNKKKTGYQSITSFLQSYDNENNFYTALYSDTENYFTKAVKTVNEKCNFNLNDESVQQVIDALMDGRKKWTTLNPYEQFIYNTVKDAIELNVPNQSVEDLIGGVTNNTVSGQRISLANFINNGDCYGHGKNEFGFRNDYWYDGNNPTNKQGAEFFAEYFSYKMTGQTEKVDEMRKYFPTACELMDKAYKIGGEHYSNDDDITRITQWADSILD